MPGMFGHRFKRGLDSSDDSEGDDVDIFRRSGNTVKQWQAAEDRAKAQKRNNYMQERKGKEKVGFGSDAQWAEASVADQKTEATPKMPAVDSIEISKPLSPQKSASPARTATSSRPTPRKTRARALAFEDDSEDDIIGLASPFSSPVKGVYEQPKMADQPGREVTADGHDSDAEIRELAARSRARKAAAEEAAKGDSAAGSPAERSFEAVKSPSVSSTAAPPTNGAAAPVQARSRTGTPVTNTSKDPIVSIFIYSPIPGTKPLIVNRRISQPLKAVRLSYCKVNNLSPELERSAFLTWRGRRVFDITNCRSLGIEVDVNGEVYIKGERDSGSLGGGETDEDGMGARIGMELTTQELFQAARQEREQRLQGVPQSQYPPVPRDTATTSDAPEAQPEAQEQKIKIILRSKGYAEYKLSVRKSTKFQQIVDVFRRQRQVPASAQISLMFDGERLEGAAEVGSSEIDDMDYVDVHVK